MSDNPERWCPVCCTRHDLGPRCPGELAATGPERFGWRIQVQGSAGVAEEFAVLVAPADDLWRARILAMPNMLWCVPGGRGTLKFVARKASEAETLARNYIAEFCQRRGYKRSIQAPASLSHSRTKEASEGRTLGAKDERLPHAIRVRFGEQRADREGRSGDLSKGGMFVATDRPLAQGRRLRLVLELGEVSLPLSGIVAWVRAVPEDDREAGMGIQLVSPPALYQHYVVRIAAERAEFVTAAPVPANG